MNRARRGAIRIPFVGWEADITSEYQEHTSTKVVNMGIGGAYLMTEAEYKPGSVVTLWIKSAHMSFFVTAQVLRNDPFGIAVCFLDLCESDRNSILEIITRFLSRGKPDTFVVGETSVCTESHLELNCNL